MPAVRVKFEEIVEGAEFASGAPELEVYALVYLPTGGVFLYGEPFDDELMDLPEDPETSDQYLEIPTKRDLGLGKPLALRYARDALPDEAFERVRRYFSGPGAYARFQELLEDHEILDDWRAYEEKAVREALAAWCEDNSLIAE